uniref:Uncharacterized protein n=1 Tax=Equus caballus TaxID=9796 RepID=A0A9L0TPH2_HORSE
EMLKLRLPRSFGNGWHWEGWGRSAGVPAGLLRATYSSGALALLSRQLQCLFI